MNIIERTVYEVACDRCGARTSHRSRTDAERSAERHRDEHAAHAALGRALEGEVLDLEAPDAPRVGSFADAVAAATRAGAGFVTWNGWVHPACPDADIEAPLCRAMDVPGTLSARRATSA